MDIHKDIKHWMRTKMVFFYDILKEVSLNVNMANKWWVNKSKLLLFMLKWSHIDSN